MLLQLAESALLPLNIEHFMDEVDKGLKDMEKNDVVKQLREGGAGEAYDTMLESVKGFRHASQHWALRRDIMAEDPTELQDPIKLRMLNDQIMNLERVWLLPQGLPDRPQTRHAIFSPAKFNAYGGAAFPGISDLLHEVEKLDAAGKKKRFLEIRKHLSDLMIVFRQAASWLAPLDQI